MHTRHRPHTTSFLLGSYGARCQMTPEVWCTLKRAEAMVGGSPSDIELTAEREPTDVNGVCALTELNGTCPLAAT